MNISLELAKELAAVAEKKGYEFSGSWGKLYVNTGTPDDGVYPAPNTNELLEVLPEHTSLDKYRKSYKASSDLTGAYTFKGDTPQDALCKLYIYLIDNDLV